jgi:antitoxin component of MazEF toxin-antitoxin module
MLFEAEFHMGGENFMTNQRVMTLEDPAGLLITAELLEQIGVSTGDKVEIKITDRALTVRPLAETEQEQIMDAAMESLMERRQKLYERLAEGAK